MPINNKIVSALHSSVRRAQFVVMQTVTTTEDWSPPDNPKLVYPRGTTGEVNRVLQEGVEVRIPVSHAPTLLAVIPASLLR